MQGMHNYHLAAAKVQRLLEVRFSDAQDAFHAIINECEAARLLSIAPHLNVLCAGQSLHLHAYCAETAGRYAYLAVPCSHALFIVPALRMDLQAHTWQSPLAASNHALTTHDRWHTLRQKAAGAFSRPPRHVPVSTTHSGSDLGKHTGKAERQWQALLLHHDVLIDLMDVLSAWAGIPKGP